MDKVNGKKTYILAGLTILATGVLFFTGAMGAVEAGKMIVAALGAITVRHAIPEKG